jgi:hypothetical protein
MAARAVSDDAAIPRNVIGHRIALHCKMRSGVGPVEALQAGRAA